MRLFCLGLIALGLLAGCGQKGPLFLPKPERPPVPVTTAAPAPTSTALPRPASSVPRPASIPVSLR